MVGFPMPALGCMKQDGMGGKMAYPSLMAFETRDCRIMLSPFQKRHWGREKEEKEREKKKNKENWKWFRKEL